MFLFIITCYEFFVSHGNSYVEVYEREGRKGKGAGQGFGLGVVENNETEINPVMFYFVGGFCV